MPTVNGGPVAPDGVGGAYQNTDSDDRAALWQSLGARQGLLSGGALSGVPGSLALTMAAFRAAVAERDAGGNTLARGYHAWSDDDVPLVFDPPSAQPRNDAVVVAVADTSAGPGAFGTGVSEPGPQVVIVGGTSGTTTPVADAAIQSFVGGGGWLRVADVPINPGDTQVNAATITLNPDANPFGWRTIGAGGTVGFQNGWGTSTFVRFRRDPADNLHLQGKMDTIGASGSQAFQLPDGFRPTFPAFLKLTGAQSATSGNVRFNMDSTGTIAVYYDGTPSYVSFNLVISLA